MLSPEERESTRKLAEALSAQLSDEKRETIMQGAHELIDELRQKFESDDVAAKVASWMADFAAGIEYVPTGMISSTLENTGMGYAFAAASLANVYTLSERKAQPGQDDISLPPAVPMAIASDYLAPSDPSPYL